MKSKNDTNTRSLESLNFSDELSRTILNSLSAHIAILDESGVILETNTAWRNYAVKGGMPQNHDGRGINYLAVCDATTGSDSADAGKAATGIRAVIHGELKNFYTTIPVIQRTVRTGTTCGRSA